MPRSSNGRTLSGRRLGVGTVAAGLVALALPGVVAPTSASAQTAATVTVTPSTTMSTVAANAYGLNTAVYDGDMEDAATVPLLQAAGVKALRFPGGSYGDIYDWQTNTANGGYVASGISFSSFESYAQSVGASPTIIVEHGDGTPSEAPRGSRTLT